MLIGQRPFFHENWYDLARMHLLQPIPDLEAKQSGAPEWYQELVEICTAKKPEERFQSLEELCEFIDSNHNSKSKKIIRRPAIFSLYSQNGKGSRHSLANKKPNSLARLGILFFASLITTLALIFAFQIVPPFKHRTQALILQVENQTGGDLSYLKSALGSPNLETRPR